MEKGNFNEESGEKVAPSLGGLRQSFYLLVTIPLAYKVKQADNLQGLMEN